jgi:crotonobetainyl-CoA:carnitine CoA-transferase CaiB-like acyl-CoA transferase
VIGILAALYERKTTGKGTLVQAGLYESVAFLVGQHMAVAAVTGETPQPMPERGRSWAVYDLFSTADKKEVFIGITSDRHWLRFCRVFDFSDWQDKQELATNQLRIEAREWLLPELTKRLSLLSQAELMTKAEQAGIPFGPVNQPVDLKDDVHMNESDSLCLVKTPAGQMAKLPKIPLRLDGSSFDVRHQPPGVGEGTLEILQKTGMTVAEIEHLVMQGVLQVKK